MTVILYSCGSVKENHEDPYTFYPGFIKQLQFETEADLTRLVKGKVKVVPLLD